MSRDELEGLIDRVGLPNVLEDLVVICNEKAEHIRCNWQDDALAKVWEHAGQVIETAATRVKV